MKKIGDVLGIPVFSSGAVARGKAFLVNDPADYMGKKDGKYFIVHPKDKDVFYGVVINHLNRV